LNLKQKKKTVKQKALREICVNITTLGSRMTLNKILEEQK